MVTRDDSNSEKSSGSDNEQANICLMLDTDDKVKVKTYYEFDTSFFASSDDKELYKDSENLKWVAWGLDVGTGSGRTSINRVCVSLIPYLNYFIAICFVLCI